MREIRKQSYSYHRKQRTINIVIQIVLLILGLMWILPLLWIILTSFRAEPGSYTSYFWPKSFTLDNYSKLILVDQQFKFTKWFINTFIVAVVSCIGSTFIVLAVSYALSRLRFKMRKPMMNIALILGMFPGFMSMVAIYYILKGTWSYRESACLSDAGLHLRFRTYLLHRKGILRYYSEIP